MATYEGYIVRVNEREDQFDDMAGYDIEASITRFCDLLEERLTNAFPGATIEVSRNERDLSSGVSVVGLGADYAQGDFSGDEAVRSSVEAIIERLFGHDGDLWAVESPR
jgi:hypothetical protein